MNWLKKRLKEKPVIPFQDTIPIRGEVHIVLRDKDGWIQDERIIKNTVTALGDAWVAQRITSGTAGTAMGYMAVGVGTPTSTALGSQLDRNALTSTTQGSGADDNDVIYVGDWAAGDATGAITEAGIFNGSGTAGTMYVSSSFGVVTKGTTDAMQIIWTNTHGTS